MSPAQQWIGLGVGVITLLVGVLVAYFKALSSHQKDMRQLQTESYARLDRVSSELRASQAESIVRTDRLASELRGEIHELRSELRGVSVTLGRIEERLLKSSAA